MNYKEQCTFKIHSAKGEYRPKEAAAVASDAITQLNEYCNKLEWKIEEQQKEIDEIKFKYNNLIENIESIICNFENEKKVSQLEPCAFITKYKRLDD